MKSTVLVLVFALSGAARATPFRPLRSSASTRSLAKLQGRYVDTRALESWVGSGRWHTDAPPPTTHLTKSERATVLRNALLKISIRR